MHDASELRSTTLSEAWLDKDESDRGSVSPRVGKRGKAKREKAVKHAKHGGKPKGKDLWAKVRAVVANGLTSSLSVVCTEGATGQSCSE